MTNTAIAHNNQEQAILAQIQNLLKELQKCAPHPDKPNDFGPQFLQSEDHYKFADEHDGMLGTVFMEAVFGSSMISAANDAIEFASDFMTDRSKANKTYSLGQNNVIRGNFNGNSRKGPEWDAMMKSYLADLPMRQSLEKYLSHHSRKLYAIRKEAMIRGLAA